MTRPATPSPLARATEALRLAETRLYRAARVIADGALAGHLPEPRLVDAFRREEAAAEYALAVLRAELDADREVAA